MCIRTQLSVSMVCVPPCISKLHEYVWASGSMHVHIHELLVYLWVLMGTHKKLTCICWGIPVYTCKHMWLGPFSRTYVCEFTAAWLCKYKSVYRFEGAWKFMASFVWMSICTYCMDTHVMCPFLDVHIMAVYAMYTHAHPIACICVHSICSRTCSFFDWTNRP